MALEKKNTDRLDLSKPEDKIKALKIYMYENYGITPENIDEKLEEQQERLRKKRETFEEIKDHPILNKTIGSRWLKEGGDIRNDEDIKSINSNNSNS